MNRQYGIGNSKYVVIFDSPPTGHVTLGMRSKLLALNMGRTQV